MSLVNLWIASSGSSNSWGCHPSPRLWAGGLGGVEAQTVVNAGDLFHAAVGKDILDLGRKCNCLFFNDFFVQGGSRAVNGPAQPVGGDLRANLADRRALMCGQHWKMVGGHLMEGPDCGLSQFGYFAFQSLPITVPGLLRRSSMSVVSSPSLGGL